MIFKRIKNLWNLSRFKTTTDNGLDSYIGGITLEEDIPLGDGKAEFITEGTEEDWDEQDKADRGLTGIFGL